MTEKERQIKLAKQALHDKGAALFNRHRHALGNESIGKSHIAFEQRAEMRLRGRRLSTASARL